MDIPHLLVFDMDGVLADVARSYRAATLITAERYLRDLLGADVPDGYFTLEHMDALKRAGGFNNDWDAAAALAIAAVSRLAPVQPRPLRLGAPTAEAAAAVAGLLRGHTLPALPVNEFAELCEGIAANGGGLAGLAAATGGRNAALVLHTGTLHDTDLITRVFQEHYLGGAAFERVCGAPPQFFYGEGLAEQEPLLVPVAVLSTVAPGRRLAIATGRPRYEAGFFLDRHGIASYFEVIVTEDDIAAAEAAEERRTGVRPSWRKPDPWSVLTALERLGEGVAAYLGDTPDDLRAARAACSVRPVWAVGCLWGAHDPAGTRQAMAAIGPDILLDTPAALAAWLGRAVPE